MKIITIIFILFVNTIFAQKKYPYLDKDSDGVILVILTEEQARKLDNMSEFTHQSIRDKEGYIKFADSLCSIKILKYEEKYKNIEESLSLSQGNYNSLMSIKMNDEAKLYDKISNLEQINQNNLLLIKNHENTIYENNKKLKLYGRHVNVAIGFGLLAFVGAFIASF